MVTEPPVSVPHSDAACFCSLVHGSPAQRDSTTFAPSNLPTGAVAAPADPAVPELAAVVALPLVAGEAAEELAATADDDDAVPLVDAAGFELDEHAVTSTGARQSVSAATPVCRRRRGGEAYIRTP
jgi:hypothetical protein